MDPTCRTCGGYPCDCGQAIGVPIQTADGLMMRSGLCGELRPWSPPREKTAEERQAEARELREKKRQASEQRAKEFATGTVSSPEVADEFLWKAVETNNMAQAQKAIALGATGALKAFVGRPSRDMSWSGDTLLHVAVQRGNLAMVQLVVENGANVNAQGEKNMYRASLFTPLMLAVRGGHREIEQYLVEAKADPNLCDSVGRTAQQQPRD